MSKLNTGRKFFATAATAALVASAIVPVASAAEFSDADQIASWAKDAVETLSAKEVISGNPDGSFAPTGNVTRAQAAKMFTVALGLSTEGTEDFADVKDGQWFQEYVVAVVNAGIVNGMSATEFAPNANLTRAQAAKMIVEAYGLEGEADLKAFTDANTVAGKWSEAYLSTAVATGVINGKGDKLAANDSISRQEFAVMLTRAIDATADNAAELLAAVEEATKALDTAVKALNTEVKADEIDAAKAEVATAKAAVKELEAAVEAAKEVVTEEQATAAKEAITAANKSIEATEAVIAKAEEDAKVLAVDSVKAINATQVEVKFNKAVTKASVIEASGANAGTLVDGVFNFKTLDGSTVTANDATGKLSDDKKTLTITTKAGEKFTGRYDVVIDGAKDEKAVAVTKFVQVLDFAKDTTAPTILKTVQNTAVKSTVTFSEPINNIGNVTYTLEDGTAVSGVVSTFATGNESVEFNLTNATVNGEALATGTKVVVTFVGAQDQNLNLLTPNPAKVTLTLGGKDGVKPVVSSITQTGAKEFTLKFSEELQANPTVTVAGAATTVEKDSKDATKYVVTTTGVLDDAMTVAVSAFTDLSGEAGTAYSKVVTFKKDAVTAKVVSSAIVKDETTGKQFLEFTFDKNVDLATASVELEGSHVKDYVTTSVDKSATVDYKDASNKKVVRVELATILDKATSDAAYKVGAAYDVTATFTGITSESAIAVDSTTAKFTLVEDGSAAVSDKVAVTSVAQGTSSKEVVVTFNGDVDLATATNIDNYVIEGAVVEAAKASNATTSTITLTLKQDSNTFTGIRNVTVKNVKKLNGTVAMDTQTIVSGSLKENVAPTVKSAQLTATNKILVTFSENVTNATAADFILAVAGVESNNVISTGTPSNNTVELTLNTALDAATIAKGLTLKAATTIDLADAAGNVVSVPTAINVTDAQ